MKRESTRTANPITSLVLIVAVALLAVALGIFDRSTVSAQPITGAIWTADSLCIAVNVNVDYETKLDVYLNGGPAGGGGPGLPDGEYYVRVLAPNGTLLGTSIGSGDETPAVVVGGSFVECYQLWAIVIKASDGTQGYDDTTNPGGEYKVEVSAVSDFANSQTKSDNFKVRQLDPLSVEKSVDASFTRTWDWTIEKTADPTELHLFDGDSGEIEYSVEATKSGPTDSDFLVSGTITISNPNDVAVTVTDVSDSVDGVAANITTVACQGSFDVPANGSVDCDYEASIGLDGSETENTATVTAESSDLSGEVTVGFEYDITEVDDSVSVDDTNSEFGGLVNISTTTSFDPYTVQFDCASLSDNDYVNGVASYTHDNTATVDGEGGELDSSTATITVYCYQLEVSKTVETGYDRRYEWTIEKSADPTTHNLLVGESATSEYTIEVTKSDPIDENHAVSGTITIVNPNPNRAATLTQVLDDVSPGLAANVNCLSLTVPADDSLVCTYSLDLPNGDERTNTATATLQNVDIDADGGETSSGTTDFDSDAEDVVFGAPDSVTLDSINVVDSYGPAPDPWPFDDDGSVTYEREFFCTADDLNGQSSVTMEFPNTATIVETNQSDDALVVVNCSEYPPLVVSKTVEPEFDRTWEWDIEKSVVPDEHTLHEDEVGESTYTIEVTKSGPIDSGWRVSGTITILNPADVEATITGVTDVVTQGPFGDTEAEITGCTIDGLDVGIPSAGSPVALGPGETMLCDYEADLPGATSGNNLATVTTTGSVPGAAGAADVNFASATITETLAEVEVTDSWDGAGGPWIFTETDVVGYTRTFDCSSVDFGGEDSVTFVVDNTATITETGDSDDARVTITCTRTPEPGEIVIQKLAEPADTPWVFQFDGPGDLANDLLSGQTNIETLEPGIYVISEDLEEIDGRWFLTGIVCESETGESTWEVDLEAGSVTIDLASGDRVSCEFFNEAQPGAVIPEAPLAILFPVIGLLMAGGGYLIWRRRQRFESVA